MAPKIARITKKESDQIRILEELTNAIVECKTFIEEFTKRNYLLKMLKWRENSRTLAVLDNKVSAALQNLSVRISGSQIDLQVADSNKLDELFIMLNKATSAGGISNQCSATSNIAKINPADLVEIARKAGMHSKEEISDELSSLGISLESINLAINQVMHKMDEISSKIDESMVVDRQRNQELQQLILQGQLEASRRDNMQLNMIMKLTGKELEKKFSTPIETEIMAKRAIAGVQTLGLKVKTIHSHGINDDAHDLDGNNGDKGENGMNGATVSDGKRQIIPGQDGYDGDDGNDGDNGEDGYDGQDGEQCPDYAVYIQILEKHNNGSVTYLIEHSGQGNKHSKEIKLNPETDIMLIDAKGGKGGDGGLGGNGGNGSHGK